MKGFVYCSSKLIFLSSLEKHETFKTVRLVMKPQLNSREAPTLTQVTSILVFFFPLYI